MRITTIKTRCNKTFLGVGRGLVRRRRGRRSCGRRSNGFGRRALVDGGNAAISQTGAHFIGEVEEQEYRVGGRKFDDKLGAVGVILEGNGDVNVGLRYIKILHLST